MALPRAQFDVLRSRLELWLTHVFRVMGGYVLATGVLIGHIGRGVISSAFDARRHRRADRRRCLDRLDGVVNFLIDPNFKWVLLAMALLWAASLVLFWVEKPDRMRS